MWYIQVMKLKAMLREHPTRKQVSAGYTELSGEETEESTSVMIRSSDKSQGTNSNQQHQIAECNYLFNVEEYNTVSPSYWGAPPSYP